MNNSLYTQLEGAYRAFVVDAKTDEVVWSHEDSVKNLILNNGLDQVAVKNLASIFTYAIAGTGIRENSFYSSGSTATVTGNLLVLTGSGTITDFTFSPTGYGALAQTGDAIKFDNGVVVDVATVSPTTLILSQSLTSSVSGSFTIWKTSQVGLQTEVKRSNTYLAGNNGTSVLFNKATHFRTWDFTIESGSSRAYSELGVGWSNLPNKTTFSRIRFPAPIVVDVGQKLRFRYELSASFGPETPVSFSLSGTGGWPFAPATNASGSLMIHRITGSTGFGATGHFISMVNAAGAAYGNSHVEPFNGGASYFISDNSLPMPPFTTGVSRVPVSLGLANLTATRLTYQTGSYTAYTRTPMTEIQANSNVIRTIGFGESGFYSTCWDARACCFSALFDQTQTKRDIDTFEITFVFRWGRTLS